MHACHRIHQAGRASVEGNAEECRSNDPGKDRRARHESLRTQSECDPARGAARLPLRVGDWRVLYQIEDGRLVILVVAICPRGSAYQ
ncbi:type II toxin-antitoxin system RelE family toxin [Cupriavidus sp. SS-3]|uniref:type II toxin-antitoxin system RelE family toxin n=1 Tax=Cupriavidus sp. SS-3 TaxID=3109596 RepID=UPI002DB7A11A|nr:type II toxin-antitoxin system RelE/ParE family toxin [Cupriavidus sp. SS-3]MEC3767324.1 type II toxin-antitoxin system RelE/ParE family toxin [Cupriavidus sp. SS-3]